jgi:N-acetylneuraminic acid mutarotase
MNKHRLSAILCVTACLCLAGTLLSGAQTTAANEWTWVAGSSLEYQPVVYGILQTPNAGNTPGGRDDEVSWIDSKGDVWIFGGNGFDPTELSSVFSDVWELNTATNVWTWMAGPDKTGQPGVYGTLGAPAATNSPGARIGAVSWTDNNGNFWLFGGEGYDTVGRHGYLNDLWEFNPSTIEWTWMGGSSTVPTVCTPYDICGQPGEYGTLGVASSGNIPGGRTGAVGWTDSSGNFWLFGGEDYFVDLNGIQGFLSDVWEFNPSTKEWTWKGGSSSPPSCPTTINCGVAGVYGTLLMPAAGNIPGSRGGAAEWTDGKGNLWLFGGFGFDSHDVLGGLNDLWQFNTSTNEWTWMGGSDALSCGGNSCNQQGIYGAWMQPAAGNIPGGRRGAVTWTDSTGDLWLFGGSGVGGSGDDLWKFNPTTNEWAWMSGSASGSTPGSYGTLGIPSFGNIPGSRGGLVSWTDSKGNFWLFGGHGLDSAGSNGDLNDLWEFQPNANGLTAAAAPTFSPGSGTYTSVQSVALSDSTSGATIYYMVNGSAPPSQYSQPIIVSSSEAIQAVAVASGFASSAAVTATYTLNLAPPATPTFSLPPGTYQGPQTVTISDATQYAAIYYTTDGSTPSTASTLYTGPITVLSSETVTVIAVAGGTASSSPATAVYTILPPPPNTWTWIGGENNLDQPGRYGPLGLPLSLNFPGGRGGSARWTDKNGNFWLFGGKGTDSAGNNGWLNDSWKYNPSDTNPQDDQWTWMGGSNTLSCNTIGGVIQCSGAAGVYGTLGTPAAGNIPGAREGSVAWTDSQGNFWLFGGYGYDAVDELGFLNDLWKYDSSANQWTWMGGSSKEEFISAAYGQPGVYGTLGTPASGNVPGSRRYAVGWTDANGNLWMFGGDGQDAGGYEGQLNDLWEFNPSTNEWTWMDGSETLGGRCYIIGAQCGQPGVYGTLGTPAASNIPGGRSGAASWTDSNGNFWLFGGTGSDSVGTDSSLNDLWKYSPATNEWTWASGTSTIPCVYSPAVGGNVCPAAPGLFGTLGVAAVGNTPGGRSLPSVWIDGSGNFWLFGGGLNDLWYYTPSTNKWAWTGGDFASSNCSYLIVSPIPDIVCDGSQGVLGTQYLPAVGNTPGARTNAMSWTDKSGNFWLFGGVVTNLFDWPGWVNELWEFQPSTATLPPAATPIFSLKPGTYASAAAPLVISNGMTNASIYYTTDGTTPTTNSPLYKGAISVASAETVDAFATAPGYVSSSVASASYAIGLMPAAPIFSVAPGTYSSAQTVTISDTTPGAKIYYTSDGTAPMLASTPYTGPLTVSSSETLNAVAIASGYSVLNGIAEDVYENSTVASATYTMTTLKTPTVTVTPSSSSITTQPLSVTVAVNGGSGNPAPTGSVTLSSGGYSSAATTLSGGSATISIPAGSLATGTDTLTANYTPDTASSSEYDSASGSASVNVTVPPSFALGGTPVTVTPGATTGNTSTITITPSGGFTGNVTLTAAITSSPAGAQDPPTLSFGNSRPVSISGAGPVTATFIIATTAATSSALVDPTPIGDRWYIPGSAALAGILLLGVPARKRSWRTMLGMLLFVAILIGGAISCGSGGNGSGAGGGGGGGGASNPGTTAGAYTITVTGTSGTSSAMGTVTLTVQ